MPPVFLSSVPESDRSVQGFVINATGGNAVHPKAFSGNNISTVTEILDGSVKLKNKNVAVIGPDATPPESNAIAVNIFGTENVNPRATAYPGSRNHKIEMPVSTRTIASPRESATPMDRLIPIAFAEMRRPSAPLPDDSIHRPLAPLLR